MTSRPSDDKQALRRALRERRAASSKAEGLRASSRVAVRLEPMLAPFETVAGFAAFDNEVDLTELYEALLGRGARLAFPRIVRDGDGRPRRGEMKFVFVESLDELVPGAFGIPEPPGPPIETAEIEAFLIPAVAFDRTGTRLGFGGGYYDRALASVDERGEKVPLLVGIGYSWQLLDERLPAESWDVRVHCIVTDRETYEPEPTD